MINKMKTKNMLTGIFIFLVITQIALISAVPSINIDMKDSFGVGETVSFNFSITSGIAESITYFSMVDCPSARLPLVELKNGTTPITETYIPFTIEESTEPQECKAVVVAVEYEIKEEKSFNIVANPSFDFQTLTCEDLSCANQKKVFVLGETIYLDYQSEVENPTIIASLTYPDGTKSAIALPTSIKAEQIGTYELEVVASKQDYKTMTEKIQFGAIEKEPQINYINIQALKNLGEEEDRGLNNFYYFLIAGVIIAILIISFIVIKKMMHKR